MKYMVLWEIHSDRRMEVLERFVKLGRKGRADVGRGVKLIGRYHSLADFTGVAIFQAKDIKDLHRYLGRWSPVCDLTVVPVLEDEETARVGRTMLADMKG